MLPVVSVNDNSGTQLKTFARKNPVYTIFATTAIYIAGALTMILLFCIKKRCRHRIRSKNRNCIFPKSQSIPLRSLSAEDLDNTPAIFL